MTKNIINRRTDLPEDSIDPFPRFPVQRLPLLSRSSNLDLEGEYIVFINTIGIQ